MAPQVVFEWWSPRHDFVHQVQKLRFYERHGVQEFYTFDDERRLLSAFLRTGAGLEPVFTEGGVTSPLLRIRLEVVDGTLHGYGPDGVLFRKMSDLRAMTAEAEAGRARAEARTAALEARLRALGVDPAG